MSDHDRPSGGRDLKRQCRGLGMAGKELLTSRLQGGGLLQIHWKFPIILCGCLEGTGICCGNW